MLRYDVGSLKPPKRMPNGWLRVDGLLTRTGIFTYRNADGTERRELRIPGEVFKGDSLASFALVPVTNDHPPELLTAENTKKYSVGSVGESIRRDGEYVAASMLVTDAETIAAMDAGKRQLSCGYACDLDFTPGTVDGERYDAIQRNIRGNHVALVDVARAGAGASVRLDSGSAVMVSFTPTKENPTMKTIKIDGVSYEVSPQVAEAYEKVERAHAEKLDAAEKTAKEAKASADRMTAERDDAKTKLAASEAARADALDPKKTAERVASRVKLETEAKKHLGADFKCDALDDGAVKLAVITKIVPTFDPKGKSAEYIAARFDAVVESPTVAAPTGVEVVRTVAEGAPIPAVNTDAAGGDENAARAKMLKDQRERNAKPVGARV